MTNLVDCEKDFANNVLKSPDAKKFYRSWRKCAASVSGTWTSIRDASFSDSGRNTLGKTIISSLRKHLSALQNGRCCYCRRHLDGIAYAQPIEHILSQHDYKQYTFNYRNLAVACYSCNHAKRNDNWSNWRLGLKKYINKDKCESFFHPRMHIYDEHISYVHLETNGAFISVYSGKTEQGRHLCASLLNNSARRILSISSNKRFSNAIDKLKNQIVQMNSAQDDSKLMDFMEALELAADPTR